MKEKRKEKDVHSKKHKKVSHNYKRHLPMDLMGMLTIDRWLVRIPNI